MAIYTSLAVSTVILNPSERCLQWSDDGQACITTKAAVHIMTPDLGINFSTPPDIKALQGDEQGEQPLGWFRTMIEPTRGQTHMWPSICQDWGAVTLGSLDVSLRELACSPSNLTSRGRCVIAILNSNAEVSLWAAAKNHLKGEWTNVRAIQDVTGLAWSKQPDYRITPTPILDSSMLALGNRAGCIEFFRFNRNSNSGGSLSHIHTEPSSDHWITHLSWVPWITRAVGHCESLLAFSTDNGNVGLVKVTQNLQSTSTIGFVPEYMTSAVFDIQGPICEADKRSVTALTWVQPPGRNPILVYTKPGIVYLWSWPSSEPTWYGTRILPLQTQKMSVGSSAISPVSGVSYVLHRDALILSLFDGSLHIIHNMTTEPTWSPPLAGNILTSAELSRTSRALFAKVTPAGISYLDVNRIGGMASYDSQSTLIWIYESLRPTDFSYKHEAQHECMLLTAPFWQLDDETVLHTTSEAFSDVSCTSGSAPIHHLRALMLHLRSNARFAALCPQVLEILSQVPPDQTTTIVLPSWTHGLNDDLRPQLRKSLTTHLFGWHNLLSLRMRLSIADLCWKLCKDPEMQAQCGQVAQGLLAAISHCVLRVLVRHLKAIIPVITASDIPFVLREVVQSLLPGSPQDLADEAQALSDTLTTSFSIDPAIAALHEHCPACRAEVPLHDITRATCPNGHAWARCSVTSFILSTSKVRTCIGCSRKALLPFIASDESQLPVAAQSWIVSDLLEAVQRCLFCGNGFVEIV
ncbi:putative zinc-finger of transcription factor IIIC complex-domain-containing protein [Suillus americanus]|nr:putative zinc-finger of transcription factor IIIC complex-domain-containing protein [Suillus americanus]